MPHFGLYRGIVVDNVDPQMNNRVRVRMKSLATGGGEAWALPCLSPAAVKAGQTALPTIGSTVWVLFEGGDADFPVWLGYMP